MATFSELQTRVERRLIDLPSAVSAEVPTLINEAIRSLEEDHDFKVMETESQTFTTTSGSHTLGDVPSDFKKMRGLPFVVHNDGSIRRIGSPYHRTAVERVYTRGDTDFTGPPQFVLDAEPDDTGDRDFEVYPYPDGNSDYSGGEYRIVVPYWRYLPDLSADADTNWFTVNAEKYIVRKATAEGFFLDWDEEHGTIWEAKASDEARRVIKVDKLYRLGGVTTLAIHKGAKAPRLRDSYVNEWDS